MNDSKKIINSTFTKITREYKRKSDRIIRYTVLSIIGIFFFTKVFFALDLYQDLSSLPKMLLGLLLVESLLFGKESKDHTSPFSIEIFDEYFLITESQRYYSKKVTKKNIIRFEKDQLDKVEYDLVTKRLFFWGSFEITIFDFNEDGTIPKEPTSIIVQNKSYWNLRLFNDDIEKIAQQLCEYAGITVVNKKTGRNLI